MNAVLQVSLSLCLLGDTFGSSGPAEPPNSYLSTETGREARGLEHCTTQASPKAAASLGNSKAAYATLLRSRWMDVERSRPNAVNENDLRAQVSPGASDKRISTSFVPKRERITLLSNIDGAVELRIFAGSLDGSADMAAQLFRSQPIPGSSAVVDVHRDTFIGGGASVGITDRLSLGLDFFRATTRVEHRSLFVSGGPLETTSTADVTTLGIDATARFRFRPGSSSVRPWIAAGVRGLQFRPENATQRIGDEVLGFKINDERRLESLVGGGVDIAVTERVALTIDAHYGRAAGWRTGAGMSVRIGSRGTSGACRQECRKAARQCKSHCRRDGSICKRSCSALRGAAKRRCRRACRKQERMCKRDCRDAQPMCRQACEHGQEACTNGGFENGTLEGWAGAYGTYESRNDADTKFRLKIDKGGAVVGRHTVMTTASDCGGFDCRVGSQILPVVPPGGGNYAVRLGNANNGGEAERLTYTVMVTEQNQLFHFRSAVVLEEPGHEHGRPFFQYLVRRARFPRRTLVGPTRIEAANNPYFDGATGNILYRKWACDTIDLRRHVGKLVEIEFTTADCGLGEHFGYAYIDALCDSGDAIKARASVSAPQRVCLSGAIHADGAESTLETDHFWSIEESDANWSRKPETEAAQWFLAEEAGPIDLKAFYASHGRQFKCNTYYRVKVAVRNGCTAWDEDVRLMFVSCPVVDAGPDLYICNDAVQPLTIGTADNGKGLRYTWSPSSQLSDSSADRPKVMSGTCQSRGFFADIYTVTAEDSDGCKAADTMSIVSVCPRRDYTELEVASCCTRGRRLTAKAVTKNVGVPYTYHWSPGGETTDSIIVDPREPTTYSVTVSGPCFVSVAERTVHPVPPPPMGAFPELAAPNGFTPNGDGVNDIFVIHDIGGAVPAYNATKWEFVVFDSWGEEIVVLRGDSDCGLTNSSLPLWDGRTNRTVIYPWWWFRGNTYAGKPLRTGSYPWRLYLENCDTRRAHRMGHVTIIR